MGEVLTNYVRGFSLEDRTAVWEGWISVLCNRDLKVDDLIKLGNMQSDDGVQKTAEQSAVLTEPPSGYTDAFKDHRYFSSNQVRSRIGIDVDLRFYPYDIIFVSDRSSASRQGQREGRELSSLFLASGLVSSAGSI